MIGSTMSNKKIKNLKFDMVKPTDGIIQKVQFNYHNILTRVNQTQIKKRR